MIRRGEGGKWEQRRKTKKKREQLKLWSLDGFSPSLSIRRPNPQFRSPSLLPSTGELASSGSPTVFPLLSSLPPHLSSLHPVNQFFLLTSRSLHCITCEQNRTEQNIRCPSFSLPSPAVSPLSFFFLLLFYSPVSSHHPHPSLCPSRTDTLYCSGMQLTEEFESHTRPLRPRL